MSENNNALLWTLIVIGALCLIATVVVIGKINAPEAVDYAKISSMITAAIANIPAPVAPTAAAVTVPTAAEIAALVVIPSNEISDNDKVNDLWEYLYAANISAMKNNTETAALAKLNDKDSLDDINDLLVASGITVDDKDDVTITNITVDETIVNMLRLESDEEGKATVTINLRVNYELDSDNKYRHVIATAIYTVDEDEDEDVTITYALKA